MLISQSVQEKLINEINEHFQDALVKHEVLYDMFTITLKREAVAPLIRHLYNHEEFKFKFLTNLCGLHYPNQKNQELGLMYQLHSFENNYRIRIKTFFPINDPVIATVTDIFNAANWMERQEYDFFGIEFKGHPNLKRILNVDDMTIFPMRKEYPAEDQARKDKNDIMFGR